MAFKMKYEKGKFAFGNKPNIGKKFTSEEPKFRSTYSVGGTSSSHSGITVPKNLITKAGGNFSYGTSKRNVNVSGGLHLPTGKGNLTIGGRTNIGKRTNISGSVTTSSGNKPTYNIGVKYKFGRRNKK